MDQLGFFTHKRSTQFRGFFNGLSAVILFLYFYNRLDILRNPLRWQSSFVHDRWPYSSNFHNGSLHVEIIRRNIAEISDNSSHLVTGSSLDNVSGEGELIFCVGLLDHDGFNTRCECLKAHPECTTGGFFDYLSFFYCKCNRVVVLGYVVLGVWLAALFYLRVIQLLITSVLRWRNCLKP